MKKNIKLVGIIILLACMFLVGCGEIQEYEIIDQPVDKEISAGVGEPIMTVRKQEPLKNVVGKADLFGRTTEKGLKILVYEGLNKNGTIKIRIIDKTTVSDEDTITRSSPEQTIEINTYGNNAKINQYKKREIEKDGYQSERVIDFDYRKNKELELARQKITILSANEFKIKYIITEIE